jgi:hypothetical protein
MTLITAVIGCIITSHLPFCFAAVFAAVLALIATKLRAAEAKGQDA